MKTITKTCLYCNTNFEALTKEHNRGNAKFCSQSCSSKYKSVNTQPKPSNAICSNCSSEFYKRESSKKGSKSGLFFCSRLCKDSAQKIGGIKEIMPPHYGIAKGKFSYREFAFNNMPNKCSKCNYSKYKQVLEVHHKDGNRSNNQLSNLDILCPTCHMESHFLSKSGRYYKSGTG